MPDLADLLDLTLDELRARARKLEVPEGPFPWRDGLVAALANILIEPGHAAGVLEVHAEGFGFLRSPHADLMPAPGDIYVSQSQIKRFELRTGSTVIGRARPPKEGERYPAMLRVERVDGVPAEVAVEPFEKLVAEHPSVRLPIAQDPWLAAVDWVAPLGLGARGVIAGPSRAERGDLLRRLARRLAADPRLTTTVLLVGERPEDVTEWRATVPTEVIATPMDAEANRHVHVADVAFERARRMAERGAEVVMLVDSLDRLVRFAVEAASAEETPPPSVAALQRTRRWLASARDLRGAGSITLITTAAPPEDDAIHAAVLRDAADLCSWWLTLRDAGSVPSDYPSLDVRRSWTRREDLLVGADELDRRRRWRAGLPLDGSGDEDGLTAVFRPTPVGDPARGTP
jgi:transcription termination factor Rho